MPHCSTYVLGKKTCSRRWRHLACSVDIMLSKRFRSLERVGRYLELFISTVGPSSHECKSQFRLANYTESCAQNLNNIKRTWQLLHEDAYLIGNIEVRNKKEIANGFNSFFANIGTIISDAVPQSTNAFSDYLTANCQTNLFILRMNMTS